MSLYTVNSMAAGGVQQTTQAMCDRDVANVHKPTECEGRPDNAQSILYHGFSACFDANSPTSRSSGPDVNPV